MELHLRGRRQSLGCATRSRGQLGAPCADVEQYGVVIKATSITIRSADATETQCLARIWYDGWQDAHARIVPAELGRVRTLQNFQERLQVGYANIRVAGPNLAPLGFHWLRGAELYQFTSPK